MNDNIKERMRYFLHEISVLCDGMPNFIFRYYIKFGKRDRKQFYNLMAEAFKDLQGYALLMTNSCWAQAAAILRVAIERISKLVVLCEHPETIEKFIERYNLQCQYYNMNEDEQKAFKKEHGLGRKRLFTDYFDYGWAEDLFPNKKYGLDQIITMARMSEAIKDKDNNLNAFAHGSLSIFQFYGQGEGWKLMERQGYRMNLISLNLFCLLYTTTWNFMSDNIDRTPLDFLFQEIFSFLRT